MTSMSLRERYRVIFGYVGNLFVFFPLLLMIPVFFTLVFSEEISHTLPFLISAALAFAFGFMLKTSTRVKPRTPITPQEAPIIVVIAWIMSIVFSALPFVFGGLLDFSRGVFEATSGWTTTGLTMFEEETVPRAFLLWRSLMQFFGGAGFAVIMMSAILGPSGFNLYHAEGRVDNLVPNIRRSINTILLIYSSYTAAGFVMYVIAGMPWFDSLNHALTALATGGFSTRNASIGAFNSPAIESITIVLMVLGATGFGVHYAFWKGNFGALKKNGEWKTLGVLLLIAIPFLMFSAVGGLFAGFSDSFRYTTFQAVSALTGTGFSTADLVPWPSVGLYVLALLMICGGMMDSTSGGIKQYRIYVVFKFVINEIKRMLLPRSAVTRVEIWKAETKNYLDDLMLKEILLVMTFYVVTLLIGVGIISGYGYSLSFSLFEFSSALNTVGLSVGITGPDAPLGIIWTQTAGMFLGRLEFIVVIFAFSRFFKDAGTSLKAKKRSD